jgi:hypothetical protein
MKGSQMKRLVATSGVLALALAGCSAPPQSQSVTPPPGAAVIVSPTHAPEKTNATPSTTAIPQNAQRITIALPSGYKSGVATLKAGTPAAITFKLQSDAGCGDDIVLPAAKWRKKLKVGESATVVYTPQKSGDLKFACSMDMYKGTIIVK